VKLVVRKTLADDAVLVLNADDSNLVDYLDSIDAGELCWFSLDKNNPLVQQQLAGNGRCCFAEAGEIVYHDGNQAYRICQISDIPMTIDGAALHNVRNVLGAVGIAAAMNYRIDQIRQGLFSFHSDAQDNPGRLNSFDLDNGARVIVDFAHNAHSVEAVVDTVKRMPARKRWAMFSSAGDRSDQEIAAIATGVCALNPDCVVIVEIEKYLRGRARGEVSELLRQACLDSGLKPLQMHFAGSPLAGAQLTLTQMQAGDLGLLLVLDQRDEVFQAISEH
jgi:UDP-N-acetylmuramyl tripeptide synthase